LHPTSSVDKEKSAIAAIVQLPWSNQIRISNHFSGRNPQSTIKVAVDKINDR
jgi:hypothetical protein